jgi:GYF domain 2
MGGANDTGPDQAIEWYLVRDGQQHGPLSDRELNELRRLGQLRSTDLLWRNGWSAWVPIATVFRTAELPQARVRQRPSEAAQVLVHLLLLAAFTVLPGLVVFLAYVGDWRAFAPGTGPHWWEMILYPSGAEARQCKPTLPERPPPIPNAQHRPSKAVRALKAFCIMILASLGTGLIVGNPAAAIGAFLATGAILLFWTWFARS